MSWWPKKKKREKMGIKDEFKRVWPVHEAFVRRHECILAGQPDHVCNSPVRACHFRTAANSGMGLKPPSWELWPGCDLAHIGEQHRIGQAAFERLYKVNLQEIARTLARRSTDKKMITYMKEKGVSV